VELVVEEVDLLVIHLEDFLVDNMAAELVNIKFPTDHSIGRLTPQNRL